MRICRGAALLPGFVPDAPAPDTSVDRLGRQRRRQVLDGTGLTGLFGVDLSYPPDNRPMLIIGQAIAPDTPALTTAIREQLGLTLRSARVSMAVIIVDAAEAPAEN